MIGFNNGGDIKNKQTKVVVWLQSVFDDGGWRIKC